MTAPGALTSLLSVSFPTTTFDLITLSFIVIIMNFYFLCPTLVAFSLKTLKNEGSFVSVEDGLESQPQ